MNFRIKIRALELGISIKELSEMLQRKYPNAPYRISRDSLSAAINNGGIMTPKAQWLCEVADRLLRELENVQEEKA